MSDIYYETYNEGEAPEEEKGRASQIVRIILRTAGITVIVLVLGFILYRIFEMREPWGTGRFIYTKDTLALNNALGTQSVVKETYGRKEYAYEKESLKEVTLTKKGDKAENYETVLLPVSSYYEKTGFRVLEANTGGYYLTDENGKQTLIKVTGFYETAGSPVEGALRANHVYLVPCAKQVQLTFRYKSDSLAKLEGHTDVSGNEFSYTLADDNGRTYGDYSYKTDNKGVYKYITMVFDGVELSDVGRLTLLISYLNDKNEKGELPIVLYDEALPLPLTSADVEKSEPETLKIHKSNTEVNK